MPVHARLRRKASPQTDQEQNEPPGSLAWTWTASACWEAGRGGMTPGLPALRPDHDFQNPTSVPCPLTVQPLLLLPFCWISNLGDGREGLSPVPQVPHASQPGPAAVPRLLPKPVRGAACSLPAPTAVPPNKVSGPLSDAALPTPHFPPSSATTFRLGRWPNATEDTAAINHPWATSAGPGARPGQGRSPRPPRLLRPPPAPLTKHLLSWGVKKTRSHLQRASEAKLWTPEETPGSRQGTYSTLFLPPWFVLFLSRGGPPKPFIPASYSHKDIRKTRRKNY